MPRIIEGMKSSLSDLIGFIERQPNAATLLAPGTAGAEYVAKARLALEGAGCKPSILPPAPPEGKA